MKGSRRVWLTVGVWLRSGGGSGVRGGGGNLAYSLDGPMNSLSAGSREIDKREVGARGAAACTGVEAVESPFVPTCDVEDIDGCRLRIPGLVPIRFLLSAGGDTEALRGGAG